MDTRKVYLVDHGVGYDVPHDTFAFPATSGSSVKEVLGLGDGLHQRLNVDFPLLHFRQNLLICTNTLKSVNSN